MEQKEQQLQQQMLSLSESQKIISKLQSEYSKTMNTLLEVQNKNEELEQYKQTTSKQLQHLYKTQTDLDKTKRSYENVLKENMRLSGELIRYKKTANQSKSESTKKEKDIMNKEMLLSDLKERSNTFLNMIKDRDDVITQLNAKIKEMTNEIEQKNEQLKVMISFSKDLNKENKVNINEFTKQAIKTIKMFYHTMNNNNNNITNINIQNTININTTDNDNDSHLHLTTFSDFENVFKNKQASLTLSDALNSNVYLPNNINTEFAPSYVSISPSFLLDMNFKSELIKQELYTSLIRESYFISFLSELLHKINIAHNANLHTLVKHVSALQNEYTLLRKQNETLRKQNATLSNKLNEVNLYASKLRLEMKTLLTNMKRGCNEIEDAYNNKLNLLYKDIKGYIKEIDALKAEVCLLKGETYKKDKYIEKVNESNKKNNWKRLLRKENVLQFELIYTNNNNDNNNCNNEDNTTDSFNISNYHKKKKEISLLKHELSKIQSEMNSLVNNNNNSSLKQISHRNQDESTPRALNYVYLLQLFYLTPLDKVFSTAELTKYNKIYTSSTILSSFTVIAVFSKHCERIKYEMCSARFEIDTSYSDIEEGLLTSKSGKNIHNNSYRVVNGQIIKLKQSEYNFAKMGEIIKHYLIVMGILSKLLKEEQTKTDVYLEVQKIFEECFYFKIDEMSDECIFFRKVIGKLLSDHMECLIRSI